MTAPPLDSFLRAFPSFDDCPSFVDELMMISLIKNAPAGTWTDHEGDHCTDFVFVLQGEKRVFKQSDSGRAITLYEIGPGEICLFNATSILASTPLPANAEARSDLSMLAVPSAMFLRQLHEHACLRDFVFRRVGQGMSEVTDLVSEIAFRRMDDRLRDYLVDRSEGGILQTTHRAIANELGTSREVVSRLLEDLAGNDLVRLSRTRIQLTGLLGNALAPQARSPG